MQRALSSEVMPAAGGNAGRLTTSKLWSNSDVNLPDYGDPVSRLGVPSNGTGPPRCRCGAGQRRRIRRRRLQNRRRSFTADVLSMVNPEYSEEARKAKWQGNVVVQVVVDEHGMPRDMRVVKSLGLGLDEKALEAVAKWRFKPGMKDGKPVPVIAVIDVTFHLL